MELPRIWNPPNPYLTEHRQLLGDPPAAELELYEDHSTSILSRNDSPDLGFRWSLNPYRGCFHACAYCLSGDTPIAMADGRIKSLADVQIGDWVYGTALRGRYRYFVTTRVLAHWAAVKPAYRITLADGTKLIASADHRFLTNRGWKHVTGTGCGQGVRPHLTMKNELLGTGKFAAPPAKDADYRQGYLCGMIRGDGLLASYGYDGRRRAIDRQYQFRLALIDSEALHRARAYLSQCGVPTREFLFQPAAVGRQPLQAIRTNARLHVERIGRIIRWPATASAHWRKGFLAGIFDAEGSYHRGILRIANTNLTIIDYIAGSLCAFNFDYAVEKTSRHPPVYYVRIRGGLKEHLRFFHMTDPIITRKRTIEGQAIKNQAALGVSSVEAMGVSLRLYDITTGTGDFIASGVVSHNCYARPTHEYFGFGAGSDFERKMFVKRDAPRLLEKAFRKPSWMGERIMFSGVTDCYQPLEAAWKLTRRCLEVCARYRNPVGLITKSLLIRRDLDVLQQLHREAEVHVSLSIAFLDEELVRALEPGAPTVRRRFETMRILADAGIPVGIGVAPIIPGLNDRDIPGLLKEAKRCGASSAFHALLRLPGSVKAVFFHRLKERLPLAAAKIEHRIRETRDGALYDSRFGRRLRGTGEYWDVIEQLWRLWTNRLGFNQDEAPPKLSTFRRPPLKRPQLEFAFVEGENAVQ